MTGDQVQTRLSVDGTMMVELSGELDLASVPALRDRLLVDVLTMRPTDIVVDLEPVSFMDSTALSALISMRRTAEGIGASLRVVNPSPFAARLLNITGLAEALGCQPVGG
jgi:anti-anti-sigma factor